MHALAVFEHDHVFALCPSIAQLGNCRWGIVEQPFLIRRIHPGARHHASAVARSNLVFVSVYQRIQCGPIYQAFFHQQRLQCLGSQRRIGRNNLVVVMMVMLMCGHKFETAITAFGLSRISALASSMANILAPSHLRLVLAFKTPSRLNTATRMVLGGERCACRPHDCRASSDLSRRCASRACREQRLHAEARSLSRLRSRRKSGQVSRAWGPGSRPPASASCCRRDH